MHTCTTPRREQDRHLNGFRRTTRNLRCQQQLAGLARIHLHPPPGPLYQRSFRGNTLRQLHLRPKHQLQFRQRLKNHLDNLRLHPAHIKSKNLSWKSILFPPIQRTMHQSQLSQPRLPHRSRPAHPRRLNPNANPLQLWRHLLAHLPSLSHRQLRSRRSSQRSSSICPTYSILRAIRSSRMCSQLKACPTALISRISGLCRHCLICREESAGTRSWSRKDRTKLGGKRLTPDFHQTRTTSSSIFRLCRHHHPGRRHHSNRLQSERRMLRNLSGSSLASNSSFSISSSPA